MQVFCFSSGHTEAVAAGSQFKASSAVVIANFCALGNLSLDGWLLK